MRKLVLLLSSAVLLMAFSSPIFSHCEIPCGIYNDEMRFDMMEEDIATIEKSMNEIAGLSRAKETNYNQIVRWVMNKESHADKIVHVVTQYFMTQRLKPVDKKDLTAYRRYTTKLVLLHEMLFYAMKAKQTTDLENVKKLRTLLADFRAVYFSREQKHKVKNMKARKE